MRKRRIDLGAARHWMAVGVGIKRWLLALALGAALMGMGLVYILLVVYRSGLLPDAIFNWLMFGFVPLRWRALLPLLVGGLVVFLALVRLGTTLVEPFRRPGDSVAASLFYHSRRSKGPHVVAIGGGTGLPSLLRGLKEYTSNITAIVTVADDGGSSGRLRQELGLLPPGDFRNNIAALSRDEALMTQVLQYRFGGDIGSNGQGELRGHAFGNLLLAALAGVTGSFDEALQAAERVLAMRGRVLPSTLEMVTLVAEVTVGDGEGRTSRIMGESAIPEAGGRIRHIAIDPPGAPAFPPAVQAILRADLVVIGPGSLYTSIMPNLLVKGIAEAIRRTRARKLYICNLATQPGETDHFSVADHVEVVADLLGDDCLDVVVANDNMSASVSGSKTIFVEMAWPPARPGHMWLVTADLVDEERPWRHDSGKLGRAVRRLLAVTAGDISGL